MAQKRRPTKADIRKKKRRKKRFMKKILNFLCMLAVLTFVICLIYTVFQIKEIRVTGNEYTSSQDVADWMRKDKFSDNTLYLFCKYNIDSVKQLPSVEDVDVRLVSPWKIEVKVHEKEMTGRIDYKNEFVYFDKNGIVLLVTSEKIEEVPYIEGIEERSEKLKPGDRLTLEDDDIYQQISELKKYLSEQKIASDRIIYENSGITLQIGGLEVLLGNEEFEEKLKQISPIMEKLAEDYNNMSGTLHLEKYEAGNSTVRFVPDEKLAGDEE
ncbi:MAG: FtsQ-type POTRA domain-containing protein [Schaedlerella sp.]|nr:FtsQ-type POTRA domain-containing protein [Schaedlerella sp.]